LGNSTKESEIQYHQHQSDKVNDRSFNLAYII
jgi:hypothetical protein